MFAVAPYGFRRSFEEAAAESKRLEKEASEKSKAMEKATSASDSILTKLAPAKVAMELIEADPRLASLPAQVRHLFDAASAEVKQVIRECAEAKKGGSLSGMSVASPKACCPIVASMRKAEAVVKTIFANIDR